MDWNEYQEWACDGLLDSAKVPGHPLVYPALGLAGETGEYVEKVKKSIRDGFDDRGAMVMELGDILWYLAVSAGHLGFSLEEVMEMNYEKLEARKAKSTVQGSGDVR